MILDEPVTLDDGSVVVVVRNNKGDEIGFNQSFPEQDS